MDFQAGASGVEEEVVGSFMRIISRFIYTSILTLYEIKEDEH